MLTKMKTTFLSILILSLLIAIGGCSKVEFDPNDSVTSILSGEYGKDRLWILNVAENGSPIENKGYVRFDSKYLQDANFKFVNVLPGISSKEFKNIPLASDENGIIFEIPYQDGGQPIIITGTVTLGQMDINLKIKP